MNHGVRRENDGDGKPARQTAQLATGHVRLDEGAPLERDEALPRRRHANLDDGAVRIRVVPRHSDGEVVPREPAPERDVPAAEDVAVELDANEGVGPERGSRARGASFGDRRVREVSRGVGSAMEGANLEGAPRRGDREERRHAGVRVHARAVDEAGDGGGDAFAASRSLPRERRQPTHPRRIAGFPAKEQVVHGAKRVDARGASLGEVDRVHADDDGAREEVAEPRALVAASAGLFRAGAVEHR